MSTTISKALLPDAAKPSVELIEKLGFSWKLDASYPTPTVAQEVQIRDENHRGPSSQVAQYAAAMRNGDQFAPIIVSGDGYTIDGNTRARAAAKNGYLTVQAFILDDNWIGGSEKVQRRMHALGAAFNVRNGRGIDRNEIGNAVKELAKDTIFSAARISALLNVSEYTVYAVLSEQRARARATDLGLTVNSKVPGGHLKKLGDAGNKLKDKPFVELLALIQDSGLSLRETQDLIRAVVEAGSDDEAVALVQKDRESRREQIAEFRAAGRSRLPVSAQLRQRLGGILAHANNPTALAENNPTVAAEHLRMMRTAVLILNTAIRYQEATQA